MQRQGQERKVQTLNIEEFQELGLAVQAAHGQVNHIDFSTADCKKYGSASHEEDSLTMLAWKVEVKWEAAEIEKLQNFTERTTFIRVRGKTMLHLLNERTPLLEMPD